MNPFLFNIPTKIIFGKGKVTDLNDEIPQANKRIMMVTDAGLYTNTDIPKKVKSLLHSRDVLIFHEIEENPSFQSVDLALGLAKEFKPDLILGLGGGSAMDAAKRVANPIGFATLPIVCIPTTSGTGSEVTPFAVFTDPDKETKEGISDVHYFPERSIIDPELTYSMPPEVRLNTGLDVLAHAAEAYLSKESFPLNDTIALHAIEQVNSYLPRAVKGDHSAMDHMSYAAMLGGVAIAHASTILPHIMGYPLTIYHQVPHGRAGIIFLPALLNYLADKKICQEKTSRLNQLFDQSGGLNNFLTGLGVSTRLRDYDVKESELENYVGKVIVKGDVSITPGSIDESLILELYKQTF